MTEPDPTTQPLRRPWLVAGWPGLGGVAVIGVTYLVHTLGAKRIHVVPGDEFFEIQHIDVQHGLASTPPTPGGAFFAWRNPDGDRDLLLFVGDAQPSSGMDRLCGELLAYASRHAVERVVTFAALASQLHPTAPSRVHGVATDEHVLAELVAAGAVPLEQGQVGGLNGVLVGRAKRDGIDGVCLLAEMPYFAGGMPNPKAAAAALRVLQQTSGVDFDVEELAEQSAQVDAQLVELYERLKEKAAASGEDLEIEVPDDEPQPEESAQPAIDEPTRQRIEALFAEASDDRSKAFALKTELDRLGVFEAYEDRFLDLFKRAE